MKLVAKLNPSVTQGFRKKEDAFEFKKDEGMYVCRQDIWQSRKHTVREKVKLKIHALNTSLMLQNVNTVLLEMDVVKTAPKVNRILSR